MHYGDHGREPISGLKYGTAIAPKYIAETQNRYIQGWANTYFNDHGQFRCLANSRSNASKAASILHDVWGDGTKEPTWTDNIHFPLGSLIFETIFCDASDEEIYTLRGSPTIPACIIDRPSLPYEEPQVKKRGHKAKILKVDTLHLLQTDFAARVEAEPGEIGWVFGSFVHDGTVDNSNPVCRTVFPYLIPR